MARASVNTLLPLDQWASMLGIDPWIFNGYDPLKIYGQQRSRDCQDAWYQYTYQGKFLSREEVAHTIATAEEVIAREINFWPGPKYIEGETQIMRRPRQNRPSSLYTQRFQWKSVTTDYYKVIQPGKERFELLEANVPVTRDSNNLRALFQAEFSNPNDYPAEELFLVFTSQARGDYPVDQTFIIRPLIKTKNDLTSAVVFNGPQYLLAPPAQLDNFQQTKLDPTDPNNFTNFADVYRRWYDTSYTEDNPAQGEATWLVPEGGPFPIGCEVNCDVYKAPICVQNNDADSGVVRIKVEPKNWPLTYPWGQVGFDKVTLNYLAGVPYEHERMDYFWADVVTKLATAMLPAEQCGCDRHNAILRYWRMLPSQGDENARPLTIEELNNPFGVGRGAIYTFHRLSRYIADVTTL